MADATSTDLSPRAVFGDSAWSAISDLTTLVASTVSFLLLGRSLGPERYGAYVGMFAVIAPLGGSLLGALPLAILQRVLRDEVSPSTIASRYLRLTSVASVIAGVAAVIIGSFIVDLSLAERAFLAVGEIGGASMVFITTAAIQSVRGFGASARLRACLAALRLAGLGVLLLGGWISILGVGIVNSIVNLAFGSFIVIVLLPRVGIRLHRADDVTGELGLSAVLAAPIASNLLQTDGDKAVLNAVGRTEEAGLYGAAFRIVMFGLTPLRSLDSALFQRFLPSGDGVRGDHLRRALDYTRLSLPLACLLAVGLLIVSPMLEIVLGEEFAESVPMVRWLALFLPLSSISTAPNNGLLGLGRAGLRAGIYGASSVVSVGCYLALIDGMGWRGALIGTLVGEVVLGALGWIGLIHYQGQADDVLESVEA